MNYSNAISQCIEFIEENIKSDLTPEVIASSSGYSVFHFLRVFNINKGMTLMEYVKKRRLSLAAIDLFKGDRIIDIALDYGFKHIMVFQKHSKRNLVLVLNNM